MSRLFASDNTLRLGHFERLWWFGGMIILPLDRAQPHESSGILKHIDVASQPAEGVHPPVRFEMTDPLAVQKAAIHDEPFHNPWPNDPEELLNQQICAVRSMVEEHVEPPAPKPKKRARRKKAVG